jgi:hypothetical protein
LCTECNNLTGGWYAPSYLSLVSAILDQIEANPDATTIQIQQLNHPSRILKQILTMFFSINGATFQEANENLKEFVLNRDSTSLSDEYRILAFS